MLEIVGRCNGHPRNTDCDEKVWIRPTSINENVFNLLDSAIELGWTVSISTDDRFDIRMFCPSCSWRWDLL